MESNIYILLKDVGVKRDYIMLFFIVLLGNKFKLSVFFSVSFITKVRKFSLVSFVFEILYESKFDIYFKLVKFKKRIYFIIFAYLFINFVVLLTKSIF